MRRLVEEVSKIFSLGQKHCDEGCDPERYQDGLRHDAEEVEEMGADGSSGSDVLV